MSARSGSFWSTRGCSSSLAKRYRADNLPGRSWRKRTGLPEIAPRIDEPSRDELGKGVAEHFQRTAGKGYHWKVEHYDGEDRLYWFVYTQDYAGADTEFSEEGEFQRRTGSAGQ